MAGYSRTLLNIIHKRQLKFFGHIMRTERIEKFLMLGKINGRKSRGRQQTKFTDNLKKMVVNHNISTTTDLVRKTEDRKDWRSMVADACYSGPGT